MSEPAAFTPGHLDMDDAFGARRIAFHVTQPAEPGRPSLFWLSGFTSVMTSTKVTHLAAWAREHGLGMGRFDYSGHGQSGGRAEDGTIGAWLNEAEAVFRHHTAGPQIVVGSSMGGWLALLLAARLRQREGKREGQREGEPGSGDGNGDAARLAGMIHIAPAWDMTERLMWDAFPPDARLTLVKDAGHRLSRPQDLTLLTALLGEMVLGAFGAEAEAEA